ncbi:MAG: hypothetical protein KJI69_01595 [Patescibacteria group bacterium]|nr:hypothetical protein [Patescibacteria group bacterium]
MNKKKMVLMAIVAIAAITIGTGIAFASTLVTDSVTIDAKVQEPIEILNFNHENLFSPGKDFWPGKPVVRWTMQLKNIADVPFSVLPRVMKKDSEGIDIVTETYANGELVLTPWVGTSIAPGATITLVVEVRISPTSSPGTIGDLVLQIDRYLSPPEVEVEENKGQLG